MMRDLTLWCGVVWCGGQVEIGLGPSGEMRYPAYPSNRWTFCGVGAFQCYDSFALESLKTAAIAAGQPDWGNGGWCFG